MTSIGDPKISVCIPSYNYARFLPDAIESVLGQTVSDFELVIVDNRSEDDTPEVVARYAQRDGRIRFLVNETNVGSIENFNRCFGHARGRYVKALCADDMLEPSCLEKSADVLDRYPAVNLVASSRLVVDGDLKPVKTLSYSRRFEIRKGTDVIRRCLFMGNLIGEPSAVMFRKVHAERGFRKKYKQLVDLDMWFRLLERGDFAFIPETLCRFRRHEGQITKSHTRDFSFAPEEIALFDEYVDKDYLRFSPAAKRIFRLLHRSKVHLNKLRYYIY